MRDPDAESSSATVPFSMGGVLDGVATWVTMGGEITGSVHDEDEASRVTVLCLAGSDDAER